VVLVRLLLSNSNNNNNHMLLNIQDTDNLYLAMLNLDTANLTLVTASNLLIPAMVNQDNQASLVNPDKCLLTTTELHLVIIICI
jgi:hypothetical protein